MQEKIEKIDQSELMIMLGKGRTALYHLRMRDTTFPKPIDHQPLRWIKSHIMAWIDSHNRISGNA
ncbi:helix-turn-helix transcriptional regulator [Aeromonas caviae]|uniref:helix-turn-helix transcriptional regulator n=1 Tax=Aeromonas caviae TaxID=648 RepID=UPI0038CFC859